MVVVVVGFLYLYYMLCWVALGWALILGKAGDVVYSKEIK